MRLLVRTVTQNFNGGGSNYSDVYEKNPWVYELKCVRTVKANIVRNLSRPPTFI